MSLTRWRARPWYKNCLRTSSTCSAPCCDSQSVDPKPLSGLC